MKNSNYFFKTVIFIIIIISTLSCIKKGRDEAVKFLNKHLKKWLLEEDRLNKKYNKKIAEEDFNTADVYNLIKKDLIPEYLKLRADIAKYSTKNKDILKINTLYINKLDYLMEGLSKIEQGLLKNNQELIKEGRKILSEQRNQKKKFLEQLSKFLEEYNIKINKGVINVS